MSIMVTIDHVKQAKMCTRGARMWFARNGLDYQQFLFHGLPVELAEATGDAFALQIAKIARDEAAGDGE